ncbi:hypothetical protein E2C01_075569 [Portunus trituberculatus]|uniref:Uncharacterized protein n=1 Tax=Portunus trituberculatus TaxID=210409 RepID=A0A5B7IGG4_PORTR|nr:hypothetical protein [Portunus trituberculatus]
MARQTQVRCVEERCSQVEGSVSQAGQTPPKGPQVGDESSVRKIQAMHLFKSLRSAFVGLIVVRGGVAHTRLFHYAAECQRLLT